MPLKNSLGGGSAKYVGDLLESDAFLYKKFYSSDKTLRAGLMLPTERLTLAEESGVWNQATVVDGSVLAHSLLPPLQ